MKILMVNKFLYPRGGAENYMLKLGEYLRSCGHEVEYFGMFDEKNCVENSLGLYTSPMDFHSHRPETIIYPLRIVYSLEAKGKLKRICESFKPDMIHLGNINFQLTPSVIDGAEEMGIPVVQTVHDSQMVCPNHLMLNMNTGEPCTKCVGNSKWSCAEGYCIHGLFFKSLIGSIEGELYRHTGTYGRVSRFICPSAFIESILLREERFAGRTTVLRNFIDIKDRKAYGKKDYILYFGRLSPEKGIGEMVKAFNKLRDISFIIAGSGPMENYVRENSFDNTRYVGFKSGDELVRLIAEAKFSFYPSVCYENCPLSVLESMAMGTPVLASRIGGIPELIEDGANGAMFSGNDSDSYADAIRRLNSDNVLLDRMTFNCLSGDYMTVERYGEEVIKLYNDVLKERR